MVCAAPGAGRRDRDLEGAAEEDLDGEEEEEEEEEEDDDDDYVPEEDVTLHQKVFAAIVLALTVGVGIGVAFALVKPSKSKPTNTSTKVILDGSLAPHLGQPYSGSAVAEPQRLALPSSPSPPVAVLSAAASSSRLMAWPPHPPPPPPSPPPPPPQQLERPLQLPRSPSPPQLSSRCQRFQDKTDLRSLKPQRWCSELFAPPLCQQSFISTANGFASCVWLGSTCVASHEVTVCPLWFHGKEQALLGVRRSSSPPPPLPPSPLPPLIECIDRSKGMNLRRQGRWCADIAHEDICYQSWVILPSGHAAPCMWEGIQAAGNCKAGTTQVRWC